MTAEINRRHYRDPVCQRAIRPSAVPAVPRPRRAAPASRESPLARPAPTTVRRIGCNRAPRHGSMPRNTGRPFARAAERRPHQRRANRRGTRPLHARGKLEASATRRQIHRPSRNAEAVPWTGRAPGLVRVAPRGCWQPLLGSAPDARADSRRKIIAKERLAPEEQIRRKAQSRIAREAEEWARAERERAISAGRQEAAAAVRAGDVRWRRRPLAASGPAIRRERSEKKGLTITVSADPVGKRGGHYDATVTVKDEEKGPPVHVPVVLQVPAQ